MQKLEHITQIQHNVHGIADTSLLATQEYADIASTTAITTAGTAADTKIATHNNVTTGVHGIADTSLLATQEYADDAAALAITTAATDATNKANADRSRRNYCSRNSSRHQSYSTQ